MVVPPLEPPKVSRARCADAHAGGGKSAAAVAAADAVGIAGAEPRTEEASRSSCSSDRGSGGTETAAPAPAVEERRPEATLATVSARVAERSRERAFDLVRRALRVLAGRWVTAPSPANGGNACAGGSPPRRGAVPRFCARRTTPRSRIREVGDDYEIPPCAPAAAAQCTAPLPKPGREALPRRSGRQARAADGHPSFAMKRPRARWESRFRRGSRGPSLRASPRLKAAL